MVDLRSFFPEASEAFLVANGMGAAPKSSRTAKVPELSEAEFQAQVIAIAEGWGWLVIHINDSRKQKAVGWPDLVLIRERVLYRELKRVGRRPTLVQQATLDALKGAGQDVGVWTPADWPDIHQALGAS